MEQKVEKQASLESVPVKRLKRELKYQGTILKMYEDTVEVNGHQAKWDFIHHDGAAAVLPVTEDGKVVIEKQFRYPMGSVVTEIPAGKLDSKEEDRLAAAKRELVEETGITAEEWIEIGEYHPASAYSDEIITMFIAKGLHFGKQNLDEDEFLEVAEIPLPELVRQVFDGTTDGKTQVAILKTAEKLGMIQR